MSRASIPGAIGGAALLVALTIVAGSCGGDGHSTGLRNVASPRAATAPAPAVSANPGGPYSGAEGTPVVFDGTRSTGTGLRFNWDFGDGSPHDTVATPTHVYADNKAFTVRLYVIDASGVKSTTAQTTATIANVAPVVAELVAPSPAPRAGVTIALGTTFTDAGTLDKHTGVWAWGDTKTSNATIKESAGSGTATGSHNYAAAGTYNLSLRVVDDNGGADTVRLTLVVAPKNQPPKANAGGPYTGVEGSAVTFDGSASTDPEGDSLGYKWDFGDATTDTGVAPTHVYADNKVYTVRLTVTDAYGARSTAAQTTATIANAAPVIASFTGPTGTPAVGTPITVQGSFSDPGKLDTHTATVEWGDATTSAGTVVESGGAGTVTATHTYTASQSYVVTLRVTDNGGAVASATLELAPPPPPPPTGGTIAVTVSTVGLDLDADGYTLSVDGTFAQTVAANGSASLTGVSAGAHTVKLGGLASNCSIGIPERATSVTVDATSQLSYEVFCVATNATTYTLVGAGDIADCARTDDEATGAVLDSIVRLEPGAVVYTSGDLAYDAATAYDYANCYDPTGWGKQKVRTFTALGNHEYKIDPNPTWDYFGDNAGPRGLGYFSYNLGAYWHIIVLNDNASYGGPARTLGSPQDQWLAADLAANTRPCVIAIWHQPFVASDNWYSSSRKIFWDRLYAAGAEIVLNGHLHTYEREYPQTPELVRDDARGIQQFIVGTGGNSTYTADTLRANTAVVAPTRGVLKLTLGPGTYSWEFVWAKGQTFTDQGSGTCH